MGAGGGCVGWLLGGGRLVYCSVTMEYYICELKWVPFFKTARPSPWRLEMSELYITYIFKVLTSAA